MNTTGSPQIASKDLTILNDQLGAEALLVHKYSQAAEAISDPAIKAQLNGIAEQHRKHYNILLNYLNSQQ